jgi:hypothetical protein
LDTQTSSQPSMDPGSQTTGQPQPAASLSVSPLPLPLAVSEGIGAEDIKQTRRLLSDIYIYIYTVDT